MSYGDGSSFEIKKTDGKSYNPKRWQVCMSYTVEAVQTRPGHANPTITLSWYAHAIPEKDHEAADLLGSILNQGNASAALPGGAISWKASANRLFPG